MAIINSYLQMLVGPQRRALMELLAYLSGVDGDVSLEEVMFISETAGQLGVDETAGELFEAVAQKGIAEVCACFDREDVRTIALAELIGIAFADGHYDEAERAAVREITSVMGVAVQKLERLETWVEQGIEWETEGRRLMSPSSELQGDW